MLVLSRKVGERILVPGCELAVTVVAVQGSVVRLGISAPGDVAVYREEVWCQLRASNQQPAEPAVPMNPLADVTP